MLHRLFVRGEMPAAWPAARCRQGAHHVADAPARRGLREQSGASTSGLAATSQARADEGRQGE